MISGPMPVGSPMVTMKGFCKATSRKAIDHFNRNGRKLTTAIRQRNSLAATAAGGKRLAAAGKKIDSAGGGC